MPASNPSSRLGLKLLAVLVVLGGGAAAALVAFRPVATVAPVVSAQAVSAKPGNVTVIQEFELPIKSEEGGRLQEQAHYMEPGDHVKKGDILAQLDPTDLQLEIEKDRLDLATSKETYATDHVTQMNLDAAQIDLDNFRRFHAMGTYSDVDLAKQERNMKIMQTQAKLQTINNQHTIDSEENALKIAQRKLDEMTIKAPLDGIVSLVAKHPGDLIGGGDPIAVLISENKVVEGKISEEDFANVRVGDEADVTFIPYGAWLFKGKVTRILPTADPATQRHVVWLEVAMDQSHPLVSGINGEVSITVDRHQANAVVPRRAVFPHNGDAVWVVKDGKVEERKVKKGFEWVTGIEIVTGLAPGEQVIVDNLESFHDGEKVNTKAVASDALRTAE